MAVTVSPPGLGQAEGEVSARLKNIYGLRLLVGEQSPSLLLFYAVFVGLAVRAYFVFSGHGMPLNDGGLFYSMVEDIRAADYALPKFTSYNGGDIPFAYPPLTFYLAAFLGDAFGWSVLGILRFLPLVASVLTIPAFFLLARTLLPDRRMVVLATFCFTLAPHAYNWEIAGGGLTRSFGYLFAILAIHYLYKLTLEPTRRRAAVCATLAAATAMSHLEMALFVAITYALILAFYGRRRQAIVYAALVTSSAFLLMAPWLGTVVANHGLDPFVAALHAGSHSPFILVRVLDFDYSMEPLYPLIASLGLLGVLACLARREYFLPVWLFAVLFLDPRKAATEAMVPLTMLGASATFLVLIPQLERLREAVSGRATGSSWVSGALPVALVAYLFYAAPFADVVSNTPLHAMDSGQVEAMRWVRENTPGESRFLVLGVPLDRGWALDAVSEWFPALSGRASPATVQATEWLPGKRGMAAAMARYNDLKVCNDKDVICLDAWAEDAGITFTHVYVGKPLEKEGSPVLARDCCAALRISLAASAEYRLIYNGETSQVYERRAASSEAR